MGRYPYSKLSHFKENGVTKLTEISVPVTGPLPFPIEREKLGGWEGNLK